MTNTAAEHSRSVVPAPNALRLLRGMIEHNCFYVLSVLVMLYGCYRLMHATPIEGDIFGQTLKTLLVLQAYEVLVILSAGLIALRFRVLGDAATLFVIELALLLDPTFFANSFYTMPTTEGALTNVACFLLVPVKLMILAAVLRLRLTPRAMGGFTIAAAAVYLAESQLSAPWFGWSEPAAFYFIGWTPLLVAVALPPISGMVAIESRRPGWLTPRQLRTISIIIPVLALLLPIAHFLESARVHEENLRLFIFHLAPIALAAGVLGYRASANAGRQGRLAPLDIAAFMALLFSLRSLNLETLPGKMSGYARHSEFAPDFLVRNVPLMVCAAVVFCAYGVLWLRLRWPALLARMVVLLAAATLYLVWGWEGWSAVAGWATGHAGAAMEWLLEHRRYGWVFVWLAIALAAWRRPSPFRVFFAVFPPLLFAARWLPGGRAEYIPELFEAAIVVLLVAHHLWSKVEERVARCLLATALAVIATVRYLDEPALGTGMVVIAIVIGLTYFALRLRYGGYLHVAMAVAFILGARGMIYAVANVPESTLGIAAGIALLGAGLLVTFNKARILDGLNGLVIRLTPVKPFDPAPAGPGYAELPIETPAAVIEHLEEPADAPVEGHVPHDEEPIPEPNDNWAIRSFKTFTPERGNLVEGMLLDIFVPSEPGGIVHCRDLHYDWWTEIPQRLNCRDQEVPVVCFFRAESGPGAWCAVLTNQRIIFNVAGEAVAFDYGQIASVNRAYGTLYLRGHAGQAFQSHGLEPIQARWLKHGLTILLAELAPDRDETGD